MAGPAVTVGTLGVEVVASLDGFRAEMAKMGPEGDKAGAALVASLAKQLRKTEAAAKSARAAALSIADSTAGTAIRQTTRAVEEVGESAIRSAGQMRQASSMIASNLLNIGNSAIATRGNLLSMSAAVPDVIAGLAQAGIKASVLVPGLAAVGAVLGTGYFLWRQYASGVDVAAKASERAKVANEGIVGTFSAVEDRLIRLAVRTGNLTQEEADLTLARRAADAEYRKTTDADQKRVDALMKVKNATISERLEMEAANKRIATAAALREESVKVATLEAAATRIETEERKGLADALEVEARARQAATDARARERAEVAEMAFMVRLEEEAARERKEAQLQEVSAEEAALERLQAKRRAIREEQFRAQDRVEQEAGRAREAAEKAEEKADRDAEKRRESADRAAQDRAKTLAADGVEIAQRAVDAVLTYRVEAARDNTDRLIAFEVAITAATDEQERARLKIRRDALKEEDTARRKSVMAAFAASKALAIAQAVIAGVLGAIQSIATYGVTPVGVAAAVIAGGMAAASVGAIAAEPAPSFHAGGPGIRAFAEMESDERIIKVTRHEEVVTAAAVDRLGGREAVRAANQGVSWGSGGMSFVTVLNNRIFDIQTAESLKRMSGPLHRLSAPGGLGSHNPYAGR